MSSSQTSRRAFVISNPASGRGRGARQQGLYLDLLARYLPGFQHAATSRAGEESLLADQAIADGFDLIVAVGGDGTWSNVADRVVGSDKDNVVLGILAAGTGNDFGRNFGLSTRSPEDAVRSLASGRVASLDVGRVVTRGSPLGEEGSVLGASAGRHFLNLIGFGFDVAVIEGTAGARFLRGEALYKITALQNLFSFRGLSFELISDEPTVDGDHLMLTISNGPFFGGSFLIAPAAELNDGLLDACAIGNASPFTRMRLFKSAAKGQHVLSPMVHTRRSGRFSVRFQEPPKYELDGNVWQAEDTEVVVEVVPGALRLVVPA